MLYILIHIISRQLNGRIIGVAKVSMGYRRGKIIAFSLRRLESSLRKIVISLKARSCLCALSKLIVLRRDTGLWLLVRTVRILQTI